MTKIVFYLKKMTTLLLLLLFLIDYGPWTLINLCFVNHNLVGSLGGVVQRVKIAPIKKEKEKKE